MTPENYDPYLYFTMMAKKHGEHWRALFIMPNGRGRTASIRTLFNTLQAEGIDAKIHNPSWTVTTDNGARAYFKIGYKGLVDQLKGNEYQQIDGTDVLTRYEEEQIRPMLRTQLSLALAKDMVIR
jgi:hypothetical protein